MLEFLADGKNHKLPEIVEYLEKYFELYNHYQKIIKEDISSE